MGNRVACDNTKFRYNDLVVAILRFSSGLIGKVTCNFGCVLPHFHNLRLFGTNATYVNKPGKAEVFKSRGPDVCPELIDAPYPGCVKGDMIPSFVSAILEHGIPDVNAEDIFRAMSVCFAIEQSIVNNNIQKVEYI
jgi:predicted dehydrogenase